MSELIAAVEIVSAIATIALVYMTLKPCRASSVSYLLGVPAGFGLMATAFAINAITSYASASLPSTGLLLGVIYLLTETYGLLFLALTYARRTRLKFVGESTSIELAIPSMMTIAVLAYALTFERSGSLDNVPVSMAISLRSIMGIAALYLVYETSRNWALTRKASEGFVTIGFAFLLIGEVGFMLVWRNLGDVAVFLGYEGRIIGLLVLLAATFVGIKKGDLTTGLKRLGLTAPAH